MGRGEPKKACGHGVQLGRSCKGCETFELDRRVRVSFGASLFWARSEAGLTQKELAEKVGMSRPAIQSLEVGRQNVTLAQVFRLARALGCEALDLWPK